jgi:hypothetical protein
MNGDVKSPMPAVIYVYDADHPDGVIGYNIVPEKHTTRYTRTPGSDGVGDKLIEKPAGPKEQRLAFEAAHPAFHFDFTIEKDVWGQERYKHSHVQAKFEGFVLGLSQAPTPEPVGFEALLEHFKNWREIESLTGKRTYAHEILLCYADKIEAALSQTKE